ncbi:MAG TPA: hypothetical protein VFG68_20255, partial [Fimbriiglobus sp.]|nr:hypothetical protein [Fimbriiglobus sp.]
MAKPNGTATATYAPDAATAAFPAPGAAGSGFYEELRRLLRSRLILVHLLALAFFVLLAALSMVVPRSAEDSALRPAQGHWWRLAVPLAESLIGTLVLWRLSGMSLRSLRLWELIFFATHAAYNGHNRFEGLADLEGAARNALSLAIGFRGLASLQGFITLILAYGVLIPNTRRRSLLGVAALTAVPFAVIPAAAAVNSILREGHVLALAVQCVLILMFPAAIAVFAASRAAALQRRAFEAERRAAQVGQYALKQRLGEGGMGEVWLAEHRLLKRPCAVKFVRPELSADPRTAARFAREVQA